MSWPALDSPGTTGNGRETERYASSTWNARRPHPAAAIMVRDANALVCKGELAVPPAWTRMAA